MHRPSLPTGRHPGEGRGPVDASLRLRRCKRPGAGAYWVPACAGMTIEEAEIAVQELRFTRILTPLIPAFSTRARIPPSTPRWTGSATNACGETAGRGKEVASSPWARRTEANLGETGSPPSRRAGQCQKTRYPEADTVSLIKYQRRHPPPGPSRSLTSPEAIGCPVHRCGLRDRIPLSRVAKGLLKQTQALRSLPQGERGTD